MYLQWAMLLWGLLPDRINSVKRHVILNIMVGYYFHEKEEPNICNFIS